MLLEVIMEHGRDVVYSRGSRWRMQFYDRATERHYTGGGDTAWEALAWMVSTWNQRANLGKRPRYVYNSDATPEFPDGLATGLHVARKINTLASVAVEGASPHSAAPFTEKIGDWSRVRPDLLVATHQVADSRKDDGHRLDDSSALDSGATGSNRGVGSTPIGGASDKAAARRARVREKLLQRKRDER